MKTKNLISSLLLPFVLSACLTEKPIQPPANSDPATAKLAQAATSVSHALFELGRIRAESTPALPKGKRLIAGETMGLQGMTTVDWSGPIEQLVKRLAKAGNYRVRVIGKQPGIPILVTVVAKNAPLASVLRDIDFQAGNHADVVAYPRNRLIELRYAKA